MSRQGEGDGSVFHKANVDGDNVTNIDAGGDVEIKAGLDVFLDGARISVRKEVEEWSTEVPKLTRRVKKLAPGPALWPQRRQGARFVWLHLEDHGEWGTRIGLKKTSFSPLERIVLPWSPVSEAERREQSPS